jgi:hypothetical protein
MTRQHDSSDRSALSLYVDFGTAAWIKAQADSEEMGLNTWMRRLIDDFKNFYALPLSVVELLDADAKAMGDWSRRDYIMHIIAQRYRQVADKGPGYEKRQKQNWPPKRGDDR